MQEFGALLLFAEHRYYGESWPFGKPPAASGHSSKVKARGDLSQQGPWGDLSLLTFEQALSDYARLIFALKSEWQAQDV
jgi:hypothetical protein